MSYSQLEERNMELERDNKVLEAQKATVVTKNQEHGTFEYIGAPMALLQEIQTTNQRLFKRWSDAWPPGYTNMTGLRLEASSEVWIEVALES